MKRWAEITSFLIGAAAALVLLAGWRVPHGRETIGSGIRLSVAPSAIVELSRTGTVLDATHVMPGDSVRTAVVVTNSSRSILGLRPRVLGGDDVVLDELLMLDVRANGIPVYRGPLAGLSRHAARVLRLVPQQSTRITLRIRLPHSAARRSPGRTTDASLAFEVAR